MKVLNVNSMLDPVMGGGTAERTRQISRFMIKAGIDCEILTTDIGLSDDILQTMEGLKITALPCYNARFRVPRINHERLLSLVGGFDVISLMNHWTLLNAIVYRAARRLKKPYVVCPAGALPIYGRSRILKTFYNSYVGYKIIGNAAGHVAITNDESLDFERYGIDRKKVTIIPNGIDREKRHDWVDAQYRRKHGLGEDPFILYVGRLHHIKGPDLLLRAFLNIKNVIKNYRLVFAGPDGGMMSVLEKMLVNEKAPYRVHFIGYIGGAEKGWAYHAADVVVIPSRQEAMSLVVLEAGQAGTPVISTDQCGFDEVERCGGGMVVEATVAALQAGILKMFEDRIRLEERGRKIKRYVSDNFSWESVVEKYRRMYEDILCRHYSASRCSVGGSATKRNSASVAIDMKDANTLGRKIARLLMRLFPNVPDKNDLSFWEIFNGRSYTEASPVVQRDIREQSALYRYNYEKSGMSLFDKFYKGIDHNEFIGKSVLDLGSFTGGRLVYWMERYGFRKGVGVDINPIFAQAGNEFACKHGVNATFDTGCGENLPYEKDSFDFVVSYDVFEHVQNCEQVVKECHRVLKPGGLLFAIFPQFFQPLESHLDFVTRLPALQWFFSGKSLTAAYNDIIQERGIEASWYKEDKSLTEWERLPTLNGITVRQFRNIISSNLGWKIVYQNRSPILSHGRKANKYIFRLLRLAFFVPARMPYLEELFLGRICWVIKKMGEAACGENRDCSWSASQ